MHKRTYSTEISFEHLCDETKAQVFVGLAIKGAYRAFCTWWQPKVACG